MKKSKIALLLLLLAASVAALTINGYFNRVAGITDYDQVQYGVVFNLTVNFSSDGNYSYCNITSQHNSTIFDMVASGNATDAGIDVNSNYVYLANYSFNVTDYNLSIGRQQALTFNMTCIFNTTANYTVNQSSTKTVYISILNATFFNSTPAGPVTIGEFVNLTGIAANLNPTMNLTEPYFYVKAYNSTGGYYSDIATLYNTSLVGNISALAAVQANFTNISTADWPDNNMTLVFWANGTQNSGVDKWAASNISVKLRPNVSIGIDSFEPVVQPRNLTVRAIARYKPVGVYCNLTLYSDMQIWNETGSIVGSTNYTKTGTINSTGYLSVTWSLNSTSTYATTSPGFNVTANCSDTFNVSGIWSNSSSRSMVLNTSAPVAMFNVTAAAFPQYLLENETFTVNLTIQNIGTKNATSVDVIIAGNFTIFNSTNVANGTVKSIERYSCSNIEGAIVYNQTSLNLTNGTANPLQAAIDPSSGHVCSVRFTVNASSRPSTNPVWYTINASSPDAISNVSLLLNVSILGHGTFTSNTGLLNFGLLNDTTDTNNKTIEIILTPSGGNLIRVTSYSIEPSYGNFTYLFDPQPTQISVATRINVTLIVGQYTQAGNYTNQSSPSSGVYAPNVTIVTLNSENVYIPTSFNVSYRYSSSDTCSLSTTAISLVTLNNNTQSGSLSKSFTVQNTANVPYTVTVASPDNTELKVTEFGYGGNTYTAEFGFTLSPGAVGTVTVNKVTPSADDGGTRTDGDAVKVNCTFASTLHSKSIQLSAYVNPQGTGSSDDPGSSSSSSSSDLSAYSNYLLITSKSDYTSVKEVYQGSSVSYPVEVCNAGTQTMTSVTISATIPTADNPSDWVVHEFKLKNIPPNGACLSGTLTIDVPPNAKVGDHEVRINAKKDAVNERTVTAKIKVLKKTASSGAATLTSEAENTFSVSNATIANKSIILTINKASQTENVTAHFLIISPKGKVLYNETVMFSLANVTDQLSVPLPLLFRLPSEYNMTVTVMDLAGNLLAEKAVAVTKEQIAAAGLSSTMKMLGYGVLISIILVIIGMWAYTGEVPLGGMLGGGRRPSYGPRPRLRLPRFDIRRRHAPAYREQQYYAPRRDVPQVSSEEMRLIGEIERLEQKARIAYHEGKHAYGRELTNQVKILMKRLEGLRERRR
ncbi:MAG: NEW3 domain-containing protein [archaeon]